MGSPVSASVTTPLTRVCERAMKPSVQSRNMTNNTVFFINGPQR